MCEQTEVTYLEGDIVWVKLGACWWPGKVVDTKNLDEEIMECFKKPPIAAVQFFDEDKYEFVKTLEQICRYNCRRKNDFIKKGLDMYRSKQREGSSFMDKFPTDVAVAETLTGGDPKILNNDIFAPEEKPNYRDIFGANKKTSDKKSKRSTSPGRWHGNTSPANVKRQPPASLSPQVIRQSVVKNITEGDVNEATDQHTRIRCQPTVQMRNDPVPKEPYKCFMCDYSTTRLNLYVIHHKYHSANGYTNSARKKSETPVSNKSGRSRSRSVPGGLDSLKSQAEISPKTLKGIKPPKPSKTPETPKASTSNQQKSSKIKVPGEIKRKDKGVKEKFKTVEKKSPKIIFGLKRSLKTGSDKVVKKKRTNEDFKERLLAEWGDVDPEAEQKEIEKLKLALGESPKPSTSCFDFDEKADSILDSKHEERAKKFAQTRKIPRFTDEKRDLETKADRNLKRDSEKIRVHGTSVGGIESSKNSNDKDKSLCDAFNSVMAETVLPDLPAVPVIPGVSQVSQSSHISCFGKPSSNQIVPNNEKFLKFHEISGGNKLINDDEEKDDKDDVENYDVTHDISKASCQPKDENSDLAEASSHNKPADQYASSDIVKSYDDSTRSADIIQFDNFSNYSDRPNHYNDHSLEETLAEHKPSELVSQKLDHIDDGTSENNYPISQNVSYESCLVSHEKPVDVPKPSTIVEDANHHEISSLSDNSNSQKLLDSNGSPGQGETTHLVHKKFNIHSSSFDDQGVSELSNQESTKPTSRREVPGLIEISRRQDNLNISDSSNFVIDTKFTDTNTDDQNLSTDDTVQKSSDDETSSNHNKDLEDDEDEDDDPIDDSLQHKDIDKDNEDGDNDDSGSRHHFKDNNDTAEFQKDEDPVAHHKDQKDDSNQRSAGDAPTNSESVDVNDEAEEIDDYDDGDKGMSIDQSQHLDEEKAPDSPTGQDSFQTHSFDQIKQISIDLERNTSLESIETPAAFDNVQVQDCNEEVYHSENKSSAFDLQSSGNTLIDEDNSVHSDTNQDCSNNSSHKYSYIADRNIENVEESEKLYQTSNHHSPYEGDITETVQSEDVKFSQASVHDESSDCDHISSKSLNHPLTAEHPENSSSTDLKNLGGVSDALPHVQLFKDIETPDHNSDLLVQDDTTEDLINDKSPNHHGVLDLSETSVDNKYEDVESHCDQQTKVFSKDVQDGAQHENFSHSLALSIHEQLEHDQMSSSNLAEPPIHHQESIVIKEEENHGIPDFSALNHEVACHQSGEVSQLPSVSVIKEKSIITNIDSPMPEESDTGPRLVESTVSSDMDHDYSTRPIESHRLETMQDSQERQVPSSEIDDEMELDINSMPVVMDDTVISDDSSIKVMSESAVPVTIPIMAGNSLPVTVTPGVVVSQQVESPKIISNTPKSPVLKVIKPATKTVKLHTGVSTLTSSNPKTSEGATIVSTKGTMSGYVFIQSSQSGQPSFYSAGKPIQQCLTLKSISHSSQQQVGKNLVVVKSPQGTVQQEMLTKSGKVTLPQRIVKNQGTVLKQVPGKTVMGRGTKYVPLTQQQLKALSASGKQTFGPKLTMQSSQTKVVLPTMQSIKNVAVSPNSLKMIGSSTLKQKANTILIQTTQSTVVSSSTALPISPTIVRQNVTRPKVIGTPSSGSSFQRVLASQASGQAQVKVKGTPPALQPRMVVQKIRSPISKTSNISQTKRVSGIFPRSQVIRKNSSKTPSIHKIIPIQTRDDAQTSKGSKESSTQSSDVISTCHLPVFQPIQPEITVSPTISQGFHSSNSVVPSTAQNTVTTSVSTIPVVSTSATSLLIPEQIAQVMASSTSDPSATYVLVSIEEPNSLQSYESPTLLYDGSSQNSSSNARTLIIDPAALTSYNNQDNIILAIPSHSGGSGIMNLSQSSSGETQTSTTRTTSMFRARGGSSSGSATSNQDILAAALANTDVFQPEVSMQDSLTVVNSSQSANGSVMTSRLLESSSSLLASSSAPLLLPSLTSVLPPTNTAGVLETSLTLSQPIMTPLEVPSSVTNMQPPPPVIPTSLELPLTITQPLNIPTQSSYNPLSLASSSSPVSNPQSIGKTFHPSMPLLSEEVSESSISSESSTVLTSTGSESLPHREVLSTLNSSYAPECSLKVAIEKPELEKEVEKSFLNPSMETSIQSYAQVPEVSSHALEDGFSSDQSKLNRPFADPLGKETQSSHDLVVQKSVEGTEQSEHAVSTSYSHSINSVPPKTVSKSLDSTAQGLVTDLESSEAIALRDSCNGEPYNRVESTSCLSENPECSSTSSNTADTSSHDVTTSQLHDVLTFSDSSTDGSTPAPHSMPLLSDDGSDQAAGPKRILEDEETSGNEESHLPIKRRKLIDER